MNSVTAEPLELAEDVEAIVILLRLRLPDWAALSGVARDGVASEAVEMLSL